ncbi:Signal transduction histidine kinase [Frankineae bacterium MT45]|nr:Signal transduction histidine kinase [Frankineae bacterium MT45]
MTRRVPRRITEAQAESLLTVAVLGIGLLSVLPFGAHQTQSAWELVLTFGAWLPLLLRSRWPLPVAVVATSIDAVHIGLAAHHHPPQSVFPAATMLALYTVALRCAPRVSWISGVAAAAIQFFVGLASSSSAGAFVLYLNWPLVSVIFGRLIAERRARVKTAEQRAVDAEATKEAEARRQVTAERVRIAHEIHDVLAHHIVVVNAQAGVAQYLLRTDPAAAEKALEGIAENTRTALEELRVTLGLLRSDPEGSDEPDDRSPTPGTADIPRLIETYREARVPVEARSSGTGRPLPTAADLALYRIVQEALTNASKHAPGSRVSVDLDWRESSVTLTIRNTRALRAAEGAGSGIGLIGMRERAAAAGGTLTAGSSADGGFEVVASLPAPLLEEAGTADNAGTADTPDTSDTSDTSDKARQEAV